MKRNPDGTFADGNEGGPGRPKGSSKMRHLRERLLDGVDDADIDNVLNALIGRAQAGDIQAIKLLLKRACGPVESIDILDRIEQLENEL